MLIYLYRKDVSFMTYDLNEEKKRLMSSASRCYINFAEDIIPILKERDYSQHMVFDLLSNEKNHFELDGENIVVTGFINHDIDTFTVKRNDDNALYDYTVIGVEEKYW